MCIFSILYNEFRYMKEIKSVDVRVVTGLPYPNHTQSSYTKTEGVCRERFYGRVSQVSASTCRYLCDTASRRRPCYGFTYYDIPPEHAQLGATVSDCRLLNETCRPTPHIRIAFTYIRERQRKEIAFNDSRKTNISTNSSVIRN